MWDHEGIISKNLQEIIFITSLERSAPHTLKFAIEYFLFTMDLPRFYALHDPTILCVLRVPLFETPSCLIRSSGNPLQNVFGNLNSVGTPYFLLQFRVSLWEYTFPVNSWTFWNLQTRRSKKKSLLTNFRNKASFKKAHPISVDIFENEFLTFWSVLDLHDFLVETLGISRLPVYTWCLSALWMFISLARLP